MPNIELDTEPCILVVDDEPDICWVLEATLYPEGYGVTLTTSGTRALALIHEKFFDVAFVDAKLPDLDGLELAARIRQDSPHTAIVLISGYFDKEDPVISEKLRAGLFVDVLPKPFDLNQVRLIAKRSVKSGQ